MNFSALLYPKKIDLPDSKFNKNIVIYEYFASPTMVMVDGLIESGDVMTRVWTRGIKKLLPKGYIPKSVLLLGLAGGSNAKLINKFFPKAKITAIEIDPYMVEIGNKYFALNKTKNLNIVIDDALHFATTLSPKDHFDLILVDCFEGKYIPKKLENLDFIQSLVDHSSYTLINRLWYGEHKEVSLSFLRSLASRFYFVKTHTASNAVVSIV